MRHGRPQRKKLIKQAAAYEKHTLSDFVITSAQNAAQSVIEEQQVIPLSAEQSTKFVQALKTKPKPNQKTTQIPECAGHSHRSPQSPSSGEKTRKSSSSQRNRAFRSGFERNHSSPNHRGCKIPRRPQFLQKIWFHRSSQQNGPAVLTHDNDSITL
ncbi:MAG: hypothetical protein M2R45_04355 [Verrucomicrobia subdivision 3 bacterium]|nr:hypothetical protein [Limisphaerales bacterium]MCS1416059.1 hypothetical protein [Limisphaerales bacterium]